MSAEILVGSKVRHIGCELSPARGIGTVVRQWGSWYFCRKCFCDISPKFVVQPSRFEYGLPVKEMIDTVCPECLHEGYPSGSTGGEDIFDVKFGILEHSCHRRLLRVI